MANWERKSSYLLREIVKFRTYIDCLQGAQTQKEAIYASRAQARARAPTSTAEKSQGGKEKQEPETKGIECTNSTTVSGNPTTP
jgi:hypothetical protein